MSKLYFLIVCLLAACPSPVSYERGVKPEKYSPKILYFESPEGLMTMSFSADLRNRTCRREVMEKRSSSKNEEFSFLLAMLWPDIRIYENEGADPLLEEKDRKSGTTMLFTTRWVLNSAQSAAAFLKHSPNPQSMSFFCGSEGYRVRLRKELASPRFARVLSEYGNKKFVSYCDAVLLFNLVYSYGKALHCWDGSEREKRLVINQGKEVIGDLGLNP